MTEQEKQDALAAALHVHHFGKQPSIVPCGHNAVQDALRAAPEAKP